MRPIQNNLANLQINQIAMEQAALQAAKNQQTARARAETTEEILKQQAKSDAAAKNTSSADPDGKKEPNSQNFKNALYSKDGAAPTNPDVPTDEAPSTPKFSRIDFKA